MEQDILYNKTRDTTEDVEPVYRGPRQCYWVSYHDGTRDFNACIDEHPFHFMHKLNKKAIPYKLSGWQQINVEEFNLWQSLNETK